MKLEVTKLELIKLKRLLKKYKKQLCCVQFAKVVCYGQFKSPSEHYRRR